MGRKRKKPQPGYFLRADKPPTQIPQSIAPQHRAEESGNTSNDVPPAGVLVPISPQGPQSPVSDNEARERRAECRDQRRLWVEIGALFVGLGGIVGLLVTLCLTREANTLARDAIKQTLDMTQVANRSWIGVDAVEMRNFEMEKMMRVRIRVKNSGNTTALKVTHRSYIIPVKEIPEGAFDVTSPISSQSEIVLTPNQVAEIAVPERGILPTDQFNDVKNGKLIIVVWSEVTYTDRFFTTGKTTLCSYYVPKEAVFYTCTKGNDAK